MSRFAHLSRVDRRSLGAVLLLACLAVAAGPVLAEGTEKTGYPPMPGGEDEGAPSVTYTQGGGSEGDQSTMSAGVCQVASHYPHNSGHSGGNINQISNINCTGTGPMTELSISTTLKKQVCFIVCWWVDFAPTGYDTKYNAIKAEAKSFIACEEGTYRGVSRHLLVWPNGNVNTGGTTSVTVPITC